MRAIPKPKYEPDAAFLACANDATNPALKTRLFAIVPEMKSAAVHYDDRASSGCLHEIPRTKKKNAELLVGDVTKGELRDLYDKQMVSSHKTARTIYDNLRSAAPGGKCPTCGFGHVITLDHFLPKSAFPRFSVVVENLVPSCWDCNSGKKAKTANNAQSFHPYYDTSSLMNDQWIFADVLQTTPITTRYFVQAPQHWNAFQALRAENHFKTYGIGPRFAIEAGSELSTLIPYFKSPRRMQPEEVRDTLDRRLRAERLHQCNSWKIALYQALRNSSWFTKLQF